MGICENYKSTKGWLYIGDDNYRYAIGEPGSHNTVVVGINPSSATPEKLDPTIRKVRKYVCQDGYDGWIMINLYPLRNKNPNEMPLSPDQALIGKNLEVIKEIMNRFPIGRIWAAWGNAINTRDYYIDTLEKIVDSSDAQWFYRGDLTKFGNPRHPLYLPQDSTFEWFPVMDYFYSFREPIIW